MPYQKPAVLVSQEFKGLLPALAMFTLPNCTIGPAYFVYRKDNVGTYTGIMTLYPYYSLQPGAIVDVEPLNDRSLPDSQLPVSVLLDRVKVSVVPERDTGYGNALVFVDNTVDIFANVSAGDKVYVYQKDAVIVPSKTDGALLEANKNILIGAAADEFDHVEAGDKVELIPGQDASAGIYYVVQKIDDSHLLLDHNMTALNSDLTGINYIIRRETGVNNAGTYMVRKKVDNNTLQLTSEFANPEVNLVYAIIKSADPVLLVRDVDFTVSLDGVELAPNMTTGGLEIVSAEVLVDYRALRIDLASSVRDYGSFAELEAVFGVGQIVPENPLAFGLSLAKMNTITKVNGLGLYDEYLRNEQNAHLKALDVIKKTEMYALAVQSHNSVVHQIYSRFVEQSSYPREGKERIALCNRTLVTTEEVVEETLTNDFRIIVNTRVDGIATIGANTLQTAAPLFRHVQRGDEVVVFGGVGAIPGTYPVTMVDSANQIQLGGGFAVSYPTTTLEYYIQRPDGLEGNGVIFHDKNAHFLSGGVAPSHYLVFGGKKHIITSVDSETKLRVVQVPGIVSVQKDISYSIIRDLTKTEQAQFLKAYSEAFRNRRFVMMWPDVLKLPVGTETKELPGWYACSAVAGMVSGLPTHQGFTNILVAGFTDFEHSADYFDDEQLDIIAEGGTCILTHTFKGTPLFIRHELTTDRTAIKYQELMVTKNVDFIAKFVRSYYKPFIGIYNVVQSTKDEMMTLGTTLIEYLKKQKMPRIGSPVTDGKIIRLEEGLTGDTIEIDFDLTIPLPLNNINIKLIV